MVFNFILSSLIHEVHCFDMQYEEDIKTNDSAIKLFNKGVI